MAAPTVLEKLVLIKRVTGFVNLGLIPLDKYVEKAEAFIGDLTTGADAAVDQPMDLSEAKRALETVRQRMLPSQEICIRSMHQVDAYLLPLRQARREELAMAAMAEKSEPMRPRP